MPPRQPDPEPLDVDAVAIVTAGTVAWAVALLVSLLLATRLRADGRGWWIAACAVGVLLGLFGIRYCRRQRESLRRKENSPESAA